MSSTNNKQHSTLHWYVIHSKPRNEQRAMLNLERQGYECYLPLFTIEKLQRKRLILSEEPLFPRYLFIHLDNGEDAKSWAPIRSTTGVSRLVRFGIQPAVVDDQLIAILQAKGNATATQPERLFTPGERLLITDGPFAGVEAVYQMSRGENRVIVLIDLLSKQVPMNIAPTNLRKLA